MMLADIWTIARKDLKQIARDRAGLFWRFGFPLVLAVLFGTVFGGSGGGMSGVKVIAVDQDNTPGSEAMIARLQTKEVLFIVREQGDPPAPYTAEQAREAVRRGNASAYIVLQPGFGAGLRNPFGGEPAEIELGIDPAQSMVAGLLEGLLMQEGFIGLQETFTDSDAMGEMVDGALEGLANEPPSLETMATRAFLGSLKSFTQEVPAESWLPGATSGDGDGASADGDGAAAWSPFTLRKADIAVQRDGKPRSGHDVSFPQALVWALLGGAASFGLSLMVEQRRGTLRRLRAAPIARGSILGGKALAGIISLAATCALLAAIGAMGFGVRADAAKLAAAILCGAWAVIGIVMLLAQFGKTEEATSGIVWACLLVMAMFGGGMMPLFVMPSWMQGLATASPMRWFVLAAEGALWRGFGWGEMLAPCAVLLAVGTVAFVAGTMRMRRAG